MRYLFIIIVVFLSGCKLHPSFKSQNVECNVGEINISSIVSNSEPIDDLIDSMYIVTLESTFNSVLSSIKKVIIGDEYIYIWDDYQSGSVAIFNKNGRFVKRLSKGLGPGEVGRVMSISYDKYHNQLLVSNNRIISVFTADGTFIKNIDINFLFADFISFNDGYLFFQYDVQNLETNLPSFVITDTLFNIRKSFYIDFKRYVMGTYFLNYSECDNEIVYHRPLDNSIYLINKEGEVRTKYLFEYSEIEADVDKYDYCRDNTFFTELETSQKGKVYFSGDFAETDNYLFLRYYQIHSGDLHVYINKNNYKIYSGLDPFLSSKLLPNLGIMADVSDNFFVKYLPLEFFGGINAMPKIIEANQAFLSHEDLDKLKNYKQDDNPLLFFYKLK